MTSVRRVVACFLISVQLTPGVHIGPHLQRDAHADSRDTAIDTRSLTESKPDLAVISTFNPTSTFPTSVERVRVVYPDFDVFVVDANSSDRSAFLSLPQDVVVAAAPNPNSATRRTSKSNNHSVQPSQSAELGPHCVVATYFDQSVGVNPPSMLQLWNASWTNAGFKTLVLGREDARKHHRYTALLEKISSLPSPYDYTMGISDYDKTCFERWAAMAALPHPVFMADMDVMNMGFKASEWCANSQVQQQTDDILLFDSFVPSLVYGDPKAYERIASLFEDAPHQLVNLQMDFDKKWPISDMGVLGFIMEHHMAPYTSLSEGGNIFVYPGARCNEDGSPACEEKDGVWHFSHSSFGSGTYPNIPRDGEGIRKIITWYAQQCHEDVSKYLPADLPLARLDNYSADSLPLLTVGGQADAHGLSLDGTSMANYVNVVRRGNDRGYPCAVNI